MPHPLVEQLRFTRSEFVRGLEGVSPAAAIQRLGPINCISWMIGHLAWQEQRYWLDFAQGTVLLPALNEQLAYGMPATTPPLDEMWDAWRRVTVAVDPWLDALTAQRVAEPLAPGRANAGTYLLRNIYHYWYHLGEAQAVRQMQGESGLPDFVGDIDGQAPYRAG